MKNLWFLVSIGWCILAAIKMANNEPWHEAIILCWLAFIMVRTYEIEDR